jgi:ATP-dependent DNA helicase RecG
MAPTEILAEQHALTLERLLKGLPVRWALFTSGMPKKQRAGQLERLKSGELQIAVGTHALIQEDVGFHRLGLAVVDEQHRFGVRQRGELQRKSVSPHVLIMTATPIPRTLALTLYGDLSVSTIDQLPPGRTPIRTHWTLEANALAAVRRAVQQGRQAYVVFPLVDESDKVDLRAAVKEWERLRDKVFPEYQVGLLHGRLKPREKEETMARFKRGEIHILAATPVIEVGIDVPNATVMVITNADRFGLAQLHQLRGRVGRGAHASDCYLVSHSRSPEAAHRLQLLCGTLDGFKLAEEDLKLRGPGEFLGEAQHGVPLLKVGDLVRDGALIEEARGAAFQMVQEDPLLKDPKHRPFRDQLRARFAGRLSLGRVA